MKTSDLNRWPEKYFGIEKMRPNLTLLKELLEPYKKKNRAKIITVGGTNGKGETALFLSRLLQQNNYLVGTFTSPHILCVNERFEFNGRKVEKERLLQVFEELREKAQGLSYYEFLFFAFCHLASLEQPDVLVLEVGLGGRLDAVNLWDADIALLASLGRDHQEYLGNSLKEILLEKLPIARSHKILVSSFIQPAYRLWAREYCRAHGVCYEDIVEKWPLLEQKNYSWRNRFLAAYAYYVFKKGEAPLLASLEQAAKSVSEEFVARWQRKNIAGREVIFVGAHNLDGVRAVGDYLAKARTGELGQRASHEVAFDACFLGFSGRSENDLRAMLKAWPATKCSQHFFVALSFDHPRACRKQVLQTLLAENQCCAFVEGVEDWKESFYRESKEGQVILVAGSYYFIGEFMQFFENQEGGKKGGIDSSGHSSSGLRSK